MSRQLQLLAGLLLICLTGLWVSSRSLTNNPTAVPQLPESEPPHAFQVHISESVPDHTLHFLVLGDWGYYGDIQLRVAQQMQQWSKKDPPSFVASVGDNMYPHGIQTASDSDFHKVFMRYQLGTPWYSIVGNHDCKGNVHAQMALSKEYPGQWNLPSQYYSMRVAFGHSVVHFFFLETCSLVCPASEDDFHSSQGFPDCEYLGNLKGSSMARDYPTVAMLAAAKQRQLTWLKHGLQEATEEGAWKVVLGHNPIYSATVNRGHNEVMKRDLLPLLDLNGVDAYFGGHDHTLQHLKRSSMDNGVEFFISGGGGYPEAHKINSGYKHLAYGKATHGFMSVHMGPNAMEVQFIDQHGESIYTTVVHKRQ